MSARSPVHRPHMAAASACCALALIASAACSYDIVPVTDDGYLNYMPSLLECDDGSLMIVYERLDSNYENGDLMLTVSSDGAVWSPPRAIVATSGNERHPSVIQLPGGTYQLYYLSDETGGYRIHMADSPDGTTWTRRGIVDLGWTTEDLVNPTVFSENNGSLTMSYDLLSNGGHVAHSEDGTTWDHDKTNASTGSLNRIMRHSDGTYVLSYQRKTGIWYYQIDIFTKTSTDRLNWSAENRVTYTQNSHDSFPIELADGRYGLYYATSTGGDPYDLYSRVSDDGYAWASEENWLSYAGWDTEPHPVTLSSGIVALAWPRGTTQSNMQVHFALLDPPTDIPGDSADAPVAVAPPVLRCWPNPFREAIFLAPATPSSEAHAINVYDISGRLLRRLEASPLAAAQWDGRDSVGRPLPSGVYFARLAAGSGADPVKLVLLR